MDISDHIKGILDTLPSKPGCYLMKNAEGTIIYVGKAISLKNRVRSYFHAEFKPRPQDTPHGAGDCPYRMDRGRVRT